MLLGLLMLTASWGGNLQGWVICYAWSLFIYGACCLRPGSSSWRMLTS